MKTLVIDAICGVGFPKGTIGEELSALGLTELVDGKFCWVRALLEDVELENLQGLYEALRDERTRVALLDAPGERPNSLIADSLAAVDTSSPPLSTDVHAALCDKAAQNVITQFYTDRARH